MQVSPNTVLVIIPGWGGDASSWKTFVDIAKKSSLYTAVCVIELPCFGARPCPNTVWNVPDYATFIQAEIATIQAAHPKDRIVVLGHSFGGQVLAYLLGSEISSGVDAAILSGAAVVRPNKHIRRAVGKVASVVVKLMLTVVSKKTANKLRYRLYRIIGSPDYTNATGMKQKIFLRVIRFDVQYVLNAITVPTLIVWGSADRYTPLRYGKKIHKQIAHATLHIFPGATHGLHLQVPQTLHDRIQLFIQSL